MRLFNCLLILWALLFVSCFDNNKTRQTPYESDKQSIDSVINILTRNSQIEQLFDLGLYNLAFEALSQNSYQDSSKVKFAYLFVENGEYDKGTYIINSIKQTAYDFEKLHLKLLCALAKQDNLESKVLLDSLKKSDIDPFDYEKKFDLLTAQAYLEHNMKNFQVAIDLNLRAIDFCKRHNLPRREFAQIFHRIGNSYNDIVRDKTPFHKSYQYCYEQGLIYYTKELQLLLESNPKNKTRIALNYITTAMLKRANKLYRELPRFYEQALNELIVYQDSVTLLTRNPVYTSIALSQFGGYYYDEGVYEPMDSLFDLNKKLISTRSLYRIKNNESLDVLEYFSQRSEELKMLFELKQQNIDSVAIDLLNLGIQCKYANLNLHKSLESEFSTNIETALNNWILLKELSLYASYSPNRNIGKLTSRLLPKYQKAITNVQSKKEIRFTNIELEKLKNFSKKNNSIIIDYQVLYSGSILISLINEDKVLLKWVDKSETVATPTIDSLLNAIKSNDLQIFKRLSHTVAEELGLTNFEKQNLIISPDEHLEKIPFDALLLNKDIKGSWNSQQYIANKTNVHLVPNLSVILDNWDDRNSMFIDIWTSEYDNRSLPYNQKLIDFLTENYKTSNNSKSPKQILHILAHTHRTDNGEIVFRLNNDTLVPKSSNWISPILAVLVGCSSGDGRNYKLEGSISQTRNFLYHGTPTVIYSIWDADNHSSTELFKHFYSFLAEGFSVSESLSKAKHLIRNDNLHPEWSNPFYWANFQVTGKDQLFN